MKFNEAHRQSKPLLICNVWDVSSAKTAEALGYEAMGTSSGAIATMLGYRDGEDMSFAELRYIVERITSNTNIPLTVDLEAGYSRYPEKIVDHIVALTALGVVGVNIEDSLIQDEERKLVDIDEFTVTLLRVHSLLREHSINLFINIRTDAFLLGLQNPLKETISRIKKYEQAGAHGIFVPCVTGENDINQLVAATSLPLNVMCMPNLPNFEVLAQLGVKRISMGNFVFNKMADDLKQNLHLIKSMNSFTQLFQPC